MIFESKNIHRPTENSQPVHRYIFSKKTITPQKCKENVALRFIRSSSVSKKKHFQIVYWSFRP